MNTKVPKTFKSHNVALCMGNLFFFFNCLLITYSPCLLVAEPVGNSSFFILGPVKFRWVLLVLAPEV